MLCYKTRLGEAYCGDSLALIDEQLEDESVDLVITSPPFAILHEKRGYQNIKEAEYADWIAQFAEKLMPKLKESGSLVIDLGGAFVKGSPNHSLYQYRTLIRLCDDGYYLAQPIFWNNPCALPNPIEYLKRKIRLKQSVDTIWWLCKSPINCKANVSNVLNPYSKQMKALFKNPEKYITPPPKAKRKKAAVRNSSWTKNHGGSIPSNLLNIANTDSHSQYLRFCRATKVEKHPARFPIQLPEFFIKMLTDENDLVVDIFGGSGTTAQAAERLGRHWKTFELNREFVAGSAFRFCTEENASDVYKKIIKGEYLEFD